MGYSTTVPLKISHAYKPLRGTLVNADWHSVGLGGTWNPHLNKLQVVLMLL